MNTISLEMLVEQAQGGCESAVQQVLTRVKPDIYSLSVRYLWHPHDAEEATQEILLKVLIHLKSFRGESLFRTWVYRIACNQLLALKKQRMERQNLNFDAMAEDLSKGLDEVGAQQYTSPEYQQLLEEIRVGCTLAMLQCLDRDARLSYIVGEIMELDHKEASEILGISTSAYRKRLSRARNAVTRFMLNHCGLVNAANRCSCSKRVTTAIALQRVDPDKLLFANAVESSFEFSQALDKIRELKEIRRAAALYRTQPLNPPEDGAFSRWLRSALDRVAC